MLLPLGTETGEPGEEVVEVGDAVSGDPGFGNNRVLDQFEIPFGDWMDQAVDWIDVNLDWLLRAIEWPFEQLIGFIVDDWLTSDAWYGSWVTTCILFFVLGSLIRNIKVGAFAALALCLCGLLGNAYWLETAKTIGFIGVAVLLCVIIGVPVGVACGRVDAIWQVVRPILDAMQVVHSFVYMLPFIFFWGIGPVSATMVTMIFALPPLIRLTNLGIRQVPEDVVEASRAYGAPEWRVLSDVQLPLARPAIMTGLNQTLLLAISMLGIAAIMGAGGLGRLLFRALSNQDVALATSGGLAFFLVAVVLDRISQPEATDSGSLFHRIRLAWAHRRDPEVLIPVDERPEPVASAPKHWFAEVTATERRWMLVAGAGATLTFLASFFTWNSDAGYMSAYGRRTDESLPGESFDGLAASGGSWFGWASLGMSLFVVAAVIAVLRAPGRGPRWLTTDGAVLASIGLFTMNLVYLLAWAPNNVSVEMGIGVWLALVGSAVAAVGSVLWVLTADHSPLHPLSADVAWGRVIGVSIAVLVLVAAGFSGWSFDARADVVVTPELQAEIDRLEEQAVLEPANAGAIAAELSALMATATAEGAIVIDGFSGDGTGFGIWILILGVVALGTTLAAAGVFGRDQHRQWVWSAITAGLGAGILGITFGWIATQVRSGDPNYVTGVGSFMAMVGGSFILASTMAVLKEFRRTTIYADDPTQAAAAAAVDKATVATDAEAAPVDELV